MQAALGDGFTADITLEAPFGDFTEVNFIATAVMRGDFIAGKFTHQKLRVFLNV